MRCDKSLSLDDVWTHLYSHNTKIQAFAVISIDQIIWQTDNWNLVDTVNTLLSALSKKDGSIEISNITYKIREVADDSLIASADGNGHLLMARTKGAAWFVAWASSDSIPELAIIDLRYAASKAH